MSNWDLSLTCAFYLSYQLDRKTPSMSHVQLRPPLPSPCLVSNALAEVRGGPRVGPGVVPGRGRLHIGPSQLVATKGSRFTLLAQSSRMAGTSEECQGLGHLNAQLKVVSGEVEKCCS
jgi:hypothetical protein